MTWESRLVGGWWAVCETLTGAIVCTINRSGNVGCAIADRIVRLHNDALLPEPDEKPLA